MKRLLLSVLLGLSMLTGFGQAPTFPTLVQRPNFFREPSTRNIWIRTDNDWRQMIDSVQLVKYIANHGTAGGVSTFNGRNGVVALALSDIPATGTPSSTTYLRGDGTWSTVSASGGVWGTITGSLINQSDLALALSNKQTTISLSTSGSSGAATFNPATGGLNIPIYSGGGGTWGSITGTLSSQTDLNTALTGKINVPTGGSSGSLYSTGLITDFNFGNPSSVVTSSGKVTQITDAVGSVVDAQGTTANQPAYNTSGGPGGLGYATFVAGQGLTGGALTSSTTFTMFIVRRVVPTASTVYAETPFYVGNANSDGYGWADYVYDPGGNPATWYGGGYFQGVSAENSRGFYSVGNKWEVVALTHNGSGNFVYNSNGTKFSAIGVQTPSTPSAANNIGGVGNTGGNGPFVGDIQRILLFNTALTDAQIFQNIQYLINNIIPPLNLNIDGDSRFSNSYTVSTQTQINLLALNINSYLSLTATPGYTTANVISDLATRVTLNVNPKATNLFTLMIGHNDVASAVPAATIWSNIQSICSTVRAAGYKIILCTDMYNSLAVNGGNGAAWNTVKDVYNGYIRASGTTVADYILDINALPHATAANMGNTTYSPDGVHPAAALASDMTTAVQTAIQTFVSANSNSLSSTTASVGSLPYFTTAGPNFSYTTPNVSTTPQYLQQTGTAGIANAPTFGPITNLNGSTVAAGSGTLNFGAYNFTLGVNYNIRAESSTTLVAGTSTVSVTGATSSSHCYTQSIAPSGVTTTTEYKAVCTTGSCTITAITSSGSTNTSDVSTIAYTVVN